MGFWTALPPLWLTVQVSSGRLLSGMEKATTERAARTCEAVFPDLVNEGVIRR